MSFILTTDRSQLVCPVTAIILTITAEAGKRHKAVVSRGQKLTNTDGPEEWKNKVVPTLGSQNTIFLITIYPPVCEVRQQDPHSLLS